MDTIYIYKGREVTAADLATYFNDNVEEAQKLLDEAVEKGFATIKTDHDPMQDLFEDFIEDINLNRNSDTIREHEEAEDYLYKRSQDQNVPKHAKEAYLFPSAISAGKFQNQIITALKLSAGQTATEETDHGTVVFFYNITHNDYKRINASFAAYKAGKFTTKFVSNTTNTVINTTKNVVNDVGIPVAKTLIGAIGSIAKETIAAGVKIGSSAVTTAIDTYRAGKAQIQGDPDNIKAAAELSKYRTTKQNEYVNGAPLHK